MTDMSMIAHDGMHGEIRPIPDPTTLTVEADRRQEAMLRHLIEVEIKHLTDLMNGRFATIELHFQMLEARRLEQRTDTMNTLTAAWTAQKDAAAIQTTTAQKNIDKSELAMSDRIRALETLMGTTARVNDERMSDIKERLTVIEAGKLGKNEGLERAHAASVDVRSVFTIVISVLFLLIAITSLLVAVYKP